MSHSTYETVQELLFFLRSGDEQAQLNAARALSYLVRDHQRNTEIRTWSQIEAYEGGGISTLVAVLNGIRSAQNPKLRHAAATAITAIVSGSWVNIELCQAELNRTNYDIPALSSMNPCVVAESFASELGSIVDASRVLIEEPCYCCDISSWPSSPRRCAHTQREAALALANLCLIFHTRDRLTDTPIRGKLTRRNSNNSENSSTNWAEDLTVQAGRALVQICASQLPCRATRGSEDMDDSELAERQLAW
eukprot:CAMPEP_0184508152 /NCGR_PEP_ID=MMETSP0198_2-20121128/611_1 /TAXON_ID=1112570 /ORGANISM="Thraustochytrium sp., Strain LLF1b" /LENGTH=249 /DNA_ID=CAMNT_0026897923 /DNA_START=366 /DNA_END=1112 /DNA_ORIENTATION=+